MTAVSSRPLDVLDTRLRPLCDAYLAAAKVPGASIAVVHRDMGYHYGYGIKSMRSGEPVTDNTSFNIGSCTKAFVSAAVASLVAEGLVRWDDPVSRHVPELELYDAWVTDHVSLRDLSANRLGLPRVGLSEAGSSPPQTQAHILSNLRHTQPVFPFRDRFGYVSYGHVVPAMAVGRITGQGFLGALTERILAPLGMTTTSGASAARDTLTDLSGWHCVADVGVVPIDTFFNDQRLGSGGMWVSGRDAQQWLRLHLNAGTVDGKTIVAREALLETHTPQTVARPGKDNPSLFYPGSHLAGYGLGWGISDFEGHPLVCHSGVDYGAAAMTMLLPRSGLGVAVYGNLQAEGAVATAYAVAATLLGLPPRDWHAYFESFAPPEKPPVEVAPLPDRLADLSAFEGRYSHPADGPLVIERSGHGLIGRMLHGYRLEFTLERVGADRFAVHFTHPEWHAMGAAGPMIVFALVDGVANRAEYFLGPIGREFSRDV